MFICIVVALMIAFCSVAFITNNNKTVGIILLYCILLGSMYHK